MSRFHRLAAALLTTLPVALSAQSPKVASAKSAKAPTHTLVAKPTLVVLITIDQMRADYFERFKSHLHGGLARLFTQGAVFSNGYQDHGITETAPGHASTLSGRFPVHTGIATNSQGVNTADAPLIGSDDKGASPFRFQGTALVDWMRAADPATRFLSVSRKDRGAILPIGRSKGPVYWYASNGTFTTSTYYTDTLPAWVRAFNDRKIPQSYAGQAWTPLLGPSAYPEPDSVALESGGKDYVFPHVAPKDPQIMASKFIQFPWMDDLTLRFAIEGVQVLGLGADSARTDLLTVSLSTLDAIGHRFGPDSKELHDQILQLDRYLAVFFDSLYKMRDARRVVVALTGDHGMTPLPTLKSTIYPNGAAKQVDLRPIWNATRARLIAAGIDSTKFAFGEYGVFSVFDAEAFLAKHINPDSVAAAFGRDVMRVQGVLRADVVPRLAFADTVHDAIARRWLHTFQPSGSAKLVVTLTPYSYWEEVSPSATHGSPHDSDAHVPIVFYGAGIVPGTYPAFARVVDMGPTLAALLHVKPLEWLDGHPLREALR